ncbi:MAG: hypothetical protein ABI465_17220 [Ktedonobacteraceae bacterium]
MRREPPIAVCAYGWGREFQLYANYLTVSGTTYPLSDLTHIHPMYQQVMGISSVRLELRFGKQKVTLRGIAALEEAQKVVDYLTSHYLDFAQPDQSQSGSGVDKKWSRTIVREVQETPMPETLPGVQLPHTQDFYIQTFTQAPTAKAETPNWQRFRQEQRERRQRRLHVERSLREHGFDVATLARRLKENTLPEVCVPIHLLSGEHAHYSSDATRCGEPSSSAIGYTYPAKEHGTLILTNKRLLYIGRKSQIVLDYGRLLHVSRLRGAIAFQAEHWYKREIFEVPRSLECTMFLEHILERFQQEQPRVSVAHNAVQFNQYVEEAPVAAVAADIDTMPLAHRQWDMATVIDSMDG